MCSIHIDDTHHSFLLYFGTTTCADHLWHCLPGLLEEISSDTPPGKAPSGAKLGDSLGAALESLTTLCTLSNSNAGFVKDQTAQRWF